jgi:hypothetical protein
MEEAALRLMNAAVAKGKAVVMMGSLSCDIRFGKEAVVMSVVNRHHSATARTISDSACLVGLGKAFLCLRCWPCTMVATKNTRQQKSMHGVSNPAMSHWCSQQQSPFVLCPP